MVYEIAKKNSRKALTIYKKLLKDKGIIDLCYSNIEKLFLDSYSLISDFDKDGTLNLFINMVKSSVLLPKKLKWDHMSTLII